MSEVVIPLIGAVSLEELQAYALLVLILFGAVATGGLLGVVLEALLGRGRAARAEDRRGGERQPEKPSGAMRPRSSVKLEPGEAPRQQIPGVDVAVARHIGMEVLEKLRSGEVKVKLVSEKCKGGEVVLDLASMELKCLEDTGVLRGLDEAPSKDEVEVV